jgi:hypothetical protein
MQLLRAPLAGGSLQNHPVLASGIARSVIAVGQSITPTVLAANGACAADPVHVLQSAFSAKSKPGAKATLHAPA